MTARLLMLALDGADSDLIDRWSLDGTLPNIGRLRARGSRPPPRGAARRNRRRALGRLSICVPDGRARALPLPQAPEIEWALSACPSEERIRARGVLASTLSHARQARRHHRCAQDPTARGRSTAFTSPTGCRTAKYFERAAAAIPRGSPQKSIADVRRSDHRAAAATWRRSTRTTGRRRSATSCGPIAMKEAGGPALSCTANMGSVHPRPSRRPTASTTASGTSSTRIIRALRPRAARSGWAIRVRADLPPRSTRQSAGWSTPAGPDAVAVLFSTTKMEPNASLAHFDVSLATAQLAVLAEHRRQRRAASGRRASPIEILPYGENGTAIRVNGNERIAERLMRTLEPNSPNSSMRTAASN